jgi:oleate hydratase
MTDPGSKNPFKDSKAYFVGGGVAALTGAAFLIRDANFPGENIFILEQLNVDGGCLDGSGTTEEGYVSRGGRMFEKHFRCTFDIFSSIPSINKPNVSIKDDIFQFNEEVVSDAKCRLLADGKRIDVSSYGLSWKHLFQMGRLLLPFQKLTDKKISDWFSESFFDTNFWWLWTTSFSFQPWSNVDELRRYFLRFIHLLPGFNRFLGILRTRYNQYDSLIQPTVNWLKEHKVNFEMNAQVTDVDFSFDNNQKTVTGIHYTQNEAPHFVDLSKNDYAFITLGSMVGNSTQGSMTTPTPPIPENAAGSWALWEKLTQKHPDFGNPAPFIDDIPGTKWESFTVTQTDPYFFQFMEEFTTNKTGTGGLVTFTKSNWQMSIVLFHQPFYHGQPDTSYVFWGYGLLPDEKGNFITDKTMAECTGEELLKEALFHLQLKQETIDSIVEDSNSIPTMMPHITSQFQVRGKNDRPDVIQKNTVNFAFLGQYCEIPKDVVFTVEYSVRSAMLAVYTLLKLNKKVPKVYEGIWNPIVSLKALIALLR